MLTQIALACPAGPLSDADWTEVGGNVTEDATTNPRGVRETEVLYRHTAGHAIWSEDSVGVRIAYGITT